MSFRLKASALDQVSHSNVLQQITKRHTVTWLPVPSVRDGTVRYVVRILFGTDFFSTVRGTDKVVRIYSVRYEVRIKRYG